MEDLKKLTIRELQDLLAERSLSTNYRKNADLVARLHSHLADEEKLIPSEKESEEDDESEQDKESGLNKEGEQDKERDKNKNSGGGKDGNSENGEQREKDINSGESENCGKNIQNSGDNGSHTKGSGGSIKCEKSSTGENSINNGIVAEGNFSFKKVEKSLEVFSGESSKSFSSG